MPRSDNYLENQKAITQSLKSDPLVAVFQITRHADKEGNNPQNTLLEDAIAKVRAMKAGGIKIFEFLLRGDNTMPLHTHSPLGLKLGLDKGTSLEEIKANQMKTYVGQTLAAITTLAEMDEFKDCTFGTGTISNPQMMQDVLANPHISFAMTAHYPGMEEGGIVRQAIDGKLPALFTASEMKDVVVEPKGAGELLNVDQPGKDTLSPDAVTQLRDAGLELFKASDFTKIALKRASQVDNERPRTDGKKWNELATEKQPNGALTPEAALTKVSLGMIAVAETISKSYNGQVPPGKEHTVATTGGVDSETLPSLATGVANSDVSNKIEEILGSIQAKPLIGILKNVVLGAGGTFMTKGYDELAKQGKFDEASADLTVAAEKAVAKIKAAKDAVRDKPLV